MSVEAGNAAGLHVSPPTSGFPPSSLPAYQWVWADATARLAQVVTATQLGGIGYQLDIQREYELVRTSPTVWGELPDRKLGLLHLVGSPANANPTTLGWSLATSLGASAAVAPTNTNVATRLMRTRQSTTAVPAAIFNFRQSTFGVVNGAGGYRFQTRFVQAAVSASSRNFVGQRPTSFTINESPIALTVINAFGLAKITTSNNWQVVHSDAVNPPVPIDLGAGFPANTVDLAFDWQFFTIDGTSYAYQLKNINSGAAVSGVVATNLPDPTVFQIAQWYGSNNLDASIVSLDVADGALGQYYP